MDIFALHSKSRAVLQMLDFVESGYSKDFKKNDIGILHKVLSEWFLPIEVIREYYGDEIAIYFAWMNFL